MEETKKYKHYATDEVIEVSVSDGVGFVNGNSYDIVKDTERTQLKGTSYFEISDSDG